MPSVRTLLLAIHLVAIGGRGYSLVRLAAEESGRAGHWHQTNFSVLSGGVRKRESPTVDFTWRTTSKPKFVTGKTQKVEPILTVFPPDVVYRNGRSRELVLHPQHHLHQPNGLKRVIYYATLPEMSRYVPPIASVPDRRYVTAVTNVGSAPYPVPVNQQRSYDPNKVGKDFVTRVQSNVIDVRPRGNKKKEYQHLPSFTIIDASPTYPDAFDRIAVLNGAAGMLDGKDRYAMLQGYGGNSLVEQFPPYQSQPMMATSFGFGANPGIYYNLKPYMQSGEMPKVIGGVTPATPPPSPLLNHPQNNLYTTFSIPSHLNPPPYPTRHNRFPSDRYSAGSPLATLLGPAPSRPPTNVIDVGQPHRFQQSVGLENPSAMSPWLPTSSLELQDKPASSLDHSPLSQDFENSPASRPLSYKNKFATHLDPYASVSPFGNKYTDFSTFNTDFSIKPNSHTFSSSPLKPHFSHVSDWLTNKPSSSLDLSTFELEDFNNALASNAAAAGQESASSLPTSTASSNADSFNDLNNTIITPYLASFPNTSSSDIQDD